MHMQVPYLFFRGDLSVPHPLFKASLYAVRLRMPDLSIFVGIGK